MAGVCAGIVVIATKALCAFWCLSSTLNTPSNFPRMLVMSYGKFKSRWSDSIDPGFKPLTNELAAWAESVLCTKDITSRKRDKYSPGDSFADCSNRSRSRMVFCYLQMPMSCIKKNLQNSSNPFVDFYGRYLSHNRASPTKMVEKTLQSESQGHEVPWFGLQLDPIGKDHLVDPMYDLFLPDHQGSGYDGP
ncbi:hypothetical protein PanWU01x14_193210 [Parasponia andersonii]|uniref:Uncharacterized protein n=1 Tax=Parasponia andersonii TaxID=3476 RepID=A0A2P5C0X2_PARAD|nr:hypothetical protein PanWU01x14_193210 [Parasponia andersonii]